MSEKCNNNKSAGQLAYEYDLSINQFYLDGSKRKPWADLDEVSKSSWEKNPTSRDGKNINFN